MRPSRKKLCPESHFNPFSREDETWYPLVHLLTTATFPFHLTSTLIFNYLRSVHELLFFSLCKTLRSTWDSEDLKCKRIEWKWTLMKDFYIPTEIIINAHILSTGADTFNDSDLISILLLNNCQGFYTFVGCCKLDWVILFDRHVISVSIVVNNLILF